MSYNGEATPETSWIFNWRPIICVDAKKKWESLSKKNKLYE